MVESGSAQSLAVLLARTFGFSLAAGVNLYATIAILGLAMHFGWVDLPSQYRVFDNPWVLGAAIALYIVEFAADKVPWIDSLWDAVHTVIRPAGAAFIAVVSIGHAQPAVQVMAALAGAALATGTHLTKATTRAIANASPEPFSNWALSLAEDGFVVGLGVLALKYPIAAAVVVAIVIAALVTSGLWLFRLLRRRAHRLRRSA